MDWNLGAACRDLDPELFFPANEHDDACTQVAAAKAQCRACPVRAACLADALKPVYDQFGELFYDVHGVRGGLTGLERERLLRRRRAA